MPSKIQTPATKTTIKKTKRTIVCCKNYKKIWRPNIRGKGVNISRGKEKSVARIIVEDPVPQEVNESM